MPRNELARAKSIFERALELPSDSRVNFLDDACEGDSDLRLQVQQLLEEFEKTSGAVSQPFDSALGRSSHIAAASDFQGTERFAVQRHLGSGAFGSVYQVWDREQQVTVALKRLHSHKPESLFRFKREFRSLVELRHPNLVRLYELLCEDKHWLFTMELIDGANFLDYVRPANGGCDVQLLRSALRQLVHGIQALHGRCLHRDLKPANVLVTRGGRLVVLDFGLVVELDVAFSGQSGTLAGTPAYMSPEQIRQSPVTPASDWYSVGVMLFQALTGVLPHPASFVQRAATGAKEDYREPRLIHADVPDDLNQICSRLLSPAPEERPDGDAIIAMLGESPHLVPNIENPAFRPRPIFVARSQELEAMNRAFAASREGALHGILIEGLSGIGKSTLVKRFFELLEQRHSNLLILKGRCYEFESVPYNALDSLIDELSRYLQKLPAAALDALLPRDAFLLPTLFPVFAGVKGIVGAPARAAKVPDVQELRQRTFAALRELLARLADRQAIILWIDDLQWGDRDSSLLLADLCSSPHQPPLLAILTYRSEEFSSSPNLQYIQKALASRSGVGHWRHIVLNRLTNDESRELLRNYLPEDTSSDVRAKILAEAEGHPLFLQELARAAASHTGLHLHAVHPALELRAVLQARVAELSPVAREVLELICVAAQPLLLPVISAATRLTYADQQAEAISILVRLNLARILGTGKGRKAEAFHDQVRSAIIELLEPESRRARHAQLAAVLASLPEVEPQTLVTHYCEAGDLSSAYDAALAAAGMAETQLAFDRAAALFEVAISIANPEKTAATWLWRKLAGALAKAGRGREAAAAYIRAAKTGAPEDAFEMQRLAADQLMRSGYIDDAMRFFREFPKQVGIKAADTPQRAVAGIVIGRLLTRLRLLRGLPRPGAAATGRDLMRLEVLRTAGIVLDGTDPLFAVYFQIQYVREAVRARDPIHLASAFAAEASIRVARGSRNPQRALELLQEAEDIARSTNHSNTIGFILFVRAYVDYLLGRVPEGITHSRRAIDYLRTHCVGVAWELTSAHILFFWFSALAGNIREIAERMPQLMQEGAARDDVNMESGLFLLGFGHYPYLAADQPEEFLAEYDRALKLWSRKGFDRQHYGALTLAVDTHLYKGDYQKAHKALLAAWKPMSRSLMLREQVLSIMSSFLRGRVALACWLDQREDSALLEEVSRYAKRLDRIGSDLSQPMAHALRAGIAVGLGRRGEALRLLAMAFEGFEKAGLHAYAAAASYVSGRIRNQTDSYVESKSPLQFFESQGVRNPAAYTRMLLPGKWL